MLINIGSGELGRVYLFRNNVYQIHSEDLKNECEASLKRKLSDFLEIKNNGVFNSELYKTQTLTCIKGHLKRLGVKGISKMNYKEAFDKLIQLWS